MGEHLRDRSARGEAPRHDQFEVNPSSRDARNRARQLATEAHVVTHDAVPRSTSRADQEDPIGVGPGRVDGV